MEEIRGSPPGMYKNPVNNRIDYQLQLVIAGFLNHQPYHLKFGWLEVDRFREWGAWSRESLPETYL